jgi:hypothetical protein
MLLGAAVVAIIVYQLTMRNMRRELDDMREIISYDKMAYNSLRETCKKLQDSLDKKVISRQNNLYQFPSDPKQTGGEFFYQLITRMKKEKFVSQLNLRRVMMKKM